MDYSDILQDISVDLSSMVKKHLKNIKKLDSKQQKQFGKLFGDMKQGIDDLSEGTNESVESDKLSKDINKSILKIDDSMSYVDFAHAVAKVLKDEYGKHNYIPFINELKKKL